MGPITRCPMCHISFHFHIPSFYQNPFLCCCSGLSAPAVVGRCCFCWGDNQKWQHLTGRLLQPLVSLAGTCNHFCQRLALKTVSVTGQHFCLWLALATVPFTDLYLCHWWAHATVSVTGWHLQLFLSLVGTYNLFWHWWALATVSDTGQHLQLFLSLVGTDNISVTGQHLQPFLSLVGTSNCFCHRLALKTFLSLAVVGTYNPFWH